ncbi:hypothetical protein A9G45_02575 [Gilliamella sp. HK2]|uniref:DUF2815 family protein n=1 Tax=unclassified Gilliamella TaxID=2685620 RepID=UPI00080E4D87|nr:DUF2815 family protein [Gilliamella apicola]OCG24200.1 hypothetical protein A9G46_09035 [Gilliamella apicola]OCG30589.1 hypothetical protein A9G45_02575 [Gilliamella apicola]
MKVKLEKVRLAFPKLFKAEQVNGEGEPQFSATFIFPKDHPNVKDIENAILQVAKEKWADKADAILKKVKAELKTCLKDGDLKADLEGFAGNYFLSASNKTRPYVINRDKTQLNPDDGVMYAGCYVYAVIDIWAMDNKFGKRICASLSGVQFFKDGDAFTGGGVASDDDFDDLSVDNEEEFSV